MFTSVRDIMSKDVWQLKKLRAMGINGLSIGTESGSDETLKLANKGYTAADILTQCKKLDEAGIEYYFVYMTGLAGKGKSNTSVPSTGMGSTSAVPVALVTRSPPTGPRRTASNLAATCPEALLFRPAQRIYGTAFHLINATPSKWRCYAANRATVPTCPATLGAGTRRPS